MTGIASVSRLPQDNAFDRTLTAIAEINGARHATIPDFFNSVRDLVIVASSSRGGSSIFTEILRHSPELVHFKGEINPFLTLAGLNYPASGEGSDFLGAEDADQQNHAKLKILEREMALDAGVNGPIDLRDPQLLNRFIGDLRWRLTIQWPDLDIDPDLLTIAIEQTFTELQQEHGWPEGAFADTQLFHLLLLRRLRRNYPTINPYYYDCDPALIRRYCPDAEISLAPPSRTIIEEPPFVMIAPKHYVDRETLATRPLILKTPSNVYRLEFLRRIFPNARMRIIHLTRHPAASINGLVDGWQYHGFFAHSLPERLAIAGYSNRFPDWGQEWWKYDLPPGWQEWTTRSLPKICGFQWRSAHATILDFLNRHKVESMRVRFEEVICDTDSRHQRFTEIADWLGIAPAPLLEAVAGELPPVMATCRPRQQRWFKNIAMLQPVLKDPAIIDIAERLGYDLNDETTA